MPVELAVVQAGGIGGELAAYAVTEHALRALADALRTQENAKAYGSSRYAVVPSRGAVDKEGPARRLQPATATGRAASRSR
jgi:hypothetical protein